MDAATNRNIQPSPTMKPTIASANRWIVRKALVQVRQKRLLRAAAILHWPRLVGVATSLWVLSSVMGTTSFHIWVRVGYVLVALGYVWVDLYYGVKRLERRVEWRALLQASRMSRSG